MRHALCQRAQDMEGEERQRVIQAVLRENEEGAQDQDGRKEIPGPGLCCGGGATSKWPDSRAEDLTNDVSVDNIVSGAEPTTHEEGKGEKLRIGNTHVEKTNVVA